MAASAAAVAAAAAFCCCRAACASNFYAQGKWGKNIAPLLQEHLNADMLHTPCTGRQLGTKQPRRAEKNGGGCESARGSRCRGAAPVLAWRPAQDTFPAGGAAPLASCCTAGRAGRRGSNAGSGSGGWRRQQWRCRPNINACT